MLNIYFGDMPSAIYNTEIYFKNTYEDSWILDDFAKKVIKKVDGSESVEDAEDFINLGASRLGTSRIVKAVKAMEK